MSALFIMISKFSLYFNVNSLSNFVYYLWKFKTEKEKGSNFVFLISSSNNIIFWTTSYLRREIDIKDNPVMRKLS